HSCIQFCSFTKYTATPVLYTLSLHDALPISAYLREHDRRLHRPLGAVPGQAGREADERVVETLIDLNLGHTARPVVDVCAANAEDRKSTRLNSSHVSISYAVFCLKKKNKQQR